MGTFLSLASVIGRTAGQVTESLSKYAAAAGGGFQKQELSADDAECCILGEANGHTTIVYPSDLEDWDTPSGFISKDLDCPVFSFHIHDGDLWMYVLYSSGEVTDRFNPLPDYWEDISDEEAHAWKGDPKIVAAAVPGVKVPDIKRYLVRWDPEEEDPKKAYANDEYGAEDWQLVDFMRRLKLPLPLDGDLQPAGQTYRMWTADTASDPAHQAVSEQKSKPWWKFW